MLGPLRQVAPGLLALLLIVSCSGAPGSGSAAPAAVPGVAAASSSTGAPAPAAAAPPGPLRELKLGMVSRIFAVLPIWVAVQAGYLAEEGLSVEELYPGASTATIAAQVSGNIDIAVTAPG